MKSRWKKYFLRSSFLILVLSLIVGGYFVPIFGFGDYISPSGEFERGKTIWDWLELLIIPLALAGGAYYLNKEEKELERGIAKDRQQEAALQSYFDRMSELLVEKKLSSTKEKEVRDIARIRTLSVLRGLDPKRKRMVLLFLDEALLISSHPERDTVIALYGADLTYADLSNIHLCQARLSNTDLSMANLKGAIFDYCDFAGAKLISADLQGCDLTGETAPGVPSSLFHADLSYANLTKALISSEQLAEVESLRGTTMPDGTVHE